MPQVPAAGHALRLLSYLAGRVEPVPAAQLARDLELPRSTTYHLLAELAEHSYVTHYPDERRWGLGVAAFELASGYQRQSPLQRLARPVLQRLVDETTHNGHLAVLHGRDVLYVVEERAPGRPLLVSDVGVRLPATTTASGLAMLAALPARQVTALYPDAASVVASAGSPATPSALRRELVAVRRRGHALESGSVTQGLASVALAVLDRTGQPLAAVALTYPEGTVTGPEELLVPLRRSVATIHRRLGSPAT
ncbi:IclR family transcriptional regulator [Janibacter melonis]|uniref:IclR family transcriptional regulator n=1 Tax=Janibacter melonis TaxID=262209 RepID=UPI00191952FF|nr:IclR family transcriptional regulator [Janibacter melonis]